MKFILIKAGDKAEVVEIEGDTIDYLKIKEYLEIDSPVTVAERNIGDDYYDLWVDDEGLLRPEKERIVSGVLVDFRKEGAKELLIGNMLILRHDEEGNSIGLTDEDIEKIMKTYMVNNDEFEVCQGNDPNKDIVLLGYFDGGTCTIKAHSNWLMYTI